LNRKVNPVRIGNLVLNGEKIYIQSMLNIPCNNIQGNVEQAVMLEKAGCEIVRVSIPDKESVKLIDAID